MRRDVHVCLLLPWRQFGGAWVESLQALLQKQHIRPEGMRHTGQIGGWRRPAGRQRPDWTWALFSAFVLLLLLLLIHFGKFQVAERRLDCVRCSNVAVATGIELGTSDV